MEDNETGDISRMLMEEANHHSGSTAELLEGAASEIDLLRDEKADLLAKVERQTTSALDWASRCGETQAQLERVAGELEQLVADNVDILRKGRGTNGATYAHLADEVARLQAENAEGRRFYHEEKEKAQGLTIERDRYKAALVRIASGERPCSCKKSDAWRCAVDQGLSTVSCGCPCHNAVQS